MARAGRVILGILLALFGIATIGSWVITLLIRFGDPGIADTIGEAIGGALAQAIGFAIFLIISAGISLVFLICMIVFLVTGRKR